MKEQGMKERISAWMDGELGERAAGEAMESLRRESEASEAWRAYHLISDALRDRRGLAVGCAARVRERLAAEPTVLAPRRLAPRPVQRFALAAAASIAAVAFVGWVAFSPQPQEVQIAKQEPKTAQSGPVAVPLSSAANDYLLAHQGFSPRVSLQGMAPYVRTVADHRDEIRLEAGK
jgi:sigma-E factor negative regulatory protein RseA